MTGNSPPRGSTLKYLAVAAAAGFSLTGPMLTRPAAAQDVAAGERIFNQCRVCHQIGETARNGVGPQLNGILSGARKAATAEGYNYSPAFKALDKLWDEENFKIYIKDPRGVTPGTKMTFPGLKDETQIGNLVVFLKQFGADGKKQ